jgi:hypothetical protein
MNATSRIDVRHGVDMTDRLAAYEAVECPAREAYDAVRRPAWGAYDAVRRPAWEAYKAVERPAWEAYEAVERPAREAYVAVERQAREAYEAECRSAWEALRCGDPLADWIIGNASRHSDRAMQVLRALPATLAELDALADAADWRETWNTLRNAAIVDGVIA